MCELSDGPGPSFETFLSDPMIRLVMASDGVSVAEMSEILDFARAALCARHSADADPGQDLRAPNPVTV